MTLTVMERMLLLGALPKEGDITTIKILHDLKQDLSLPEQELKDLEMKQVPGGGLKWKREKEVDKEVEFGPKALEIATDGLKELNKQKKLSEDHLSLWGKFCPDE